MGVMDHTARACPSKPFWLINESQLPSDPEQARWHLQLMSVAGTSLAMCVIRHLLRCHGTAHRARRGDRPVDIGTWPLSPTQVEGLRAALYFLRRHGEGLLQAERDG